MLPPQGHAVEVESLNFLQFLQGQITGPLRLKLRDTQWRRVLDACLMALLEHVRTAVATERQPNNMPTDIDIDEVYSGVQALGAGGIRPSDPWQVAALAFLAQDYEQAVHLWESRPVSPNHLADYNRS